MMRVLNSIECPVSARGGKYFMYAIIEACGRQYRVAPGDKVQMEKLGLEVGDEVTFDKVLLVGDDDKVQLGEPTIAGASVTAKVEENGKAKKVIVFKYKNKTNQRRFRGHRQPFTVVSITAINV